jgi:hypothetical protein
MCLAACLLLAAASGCGLKSPWSRGQDGPLLESVQVAELQPGCYCEIEMVVPLTALRGSFDCYKGTVTEITHDEIVLTDVVEESCIEYATTSQRRPPTRQKRELVRVPRTGIDEIWAWPPAKVDAAAKPPSQPPAATLPSSAAHAALPPPAAASATAEEPGSPPAASRFSPAQPGPPADNAPR